MLRMLDISSREYALEVTGHPVRVRKWLTGAAAMLIGGYKNYFETHMFLTS
jgi:hypothetical protein